MCFVFLVIERRLVLAQCSVCFYHLTSAFTVSVRADNRARGGSTMGNSFLTFNIVLSCVILSLNRGFLSLLTILPMS